MSFQSSKIKCPNCSHEFDVEQALSGQLEKHFQKEYEQKIQENAKIYFQKEKDLEDQKSLFEEKKKNENALFQKRLEKKIEEEKEGIKKKAKESFEEKIKYLEQENTKSKEENRALKSKEIDLLKKENKLKEEREELELNLEKKMLERQADIEDKAREKERQKLSLREAEWEKKLNDQKKMIEEMKRKAEQGSMQLQGEVLELMLEEELKRQFPFDEILEVAKGQRGADIIQVVYDEGRNQCGRIIIETKRTKEFSAGWIDKLLKDKISSKGDVAVLITQALPKNQKGMDLKEGIWICSYTDYLGLIKVLRQSLISLSSARSAQLNKGDKMEVLYNYLVSEEFKMQVQTMVSGFTKLQEDLDRERRAMHRIWKEREKHIGMIEESTIDMFASIKSIAGKALPGIKELELPFDDASDAIIEDED